jgi:hypothetical protein
MSRPKRVPSPNRIRPALEVLDDRAVPATLIDLTTDGSSGEANGALLQQCDAQPTGTGVIRSFLRVQANGVEHGYNTDARPLQFDENKSPQFTRSLTLGEVPTVTVNGVEYREFLLDINQKSSAPLLSLDELRLYVGSAGNLSGYNTSTKTLAGLSPVFDLDGAGDVTVKMNYRLNAGSGAGDVFVLVPAAAFDGQPAGSFVYLYSKFGGIHTGNAGFEEWAVRVIPAGQNPPPAGTGSLSGSVYFDQNFSGFRDADESGYLGIVMQLQGVDDLGQTVVLTAVTDEFGRYTFTDLRPGLYSIFRTTDPVGAEGEAPLLDGSNTIGTLGGTDYFPDPDDPTIAWEGIIDITLLAGQDGFRYDFGFVEDNPN